MNAKRIGDLPIGLSRERRREKMIHLIGKAFISTSHDGETFRTGEIVGQISPTHYLARFDDMSGDGTTMGMEVVDLNEMSSPCEGCGNHRWELFESRDKMQEYLDYFNKPSKPAKIHAIKDAGEKRH